jgi:hypothetical protein
VAEPEGLNVAEPAGSDRAGGNGEARRETLSADPSWFGYLVGGIVGAVLATAIIVGFALVLEGLP